MDGKERQAVAAILQAVRGDERQQSWDIRRWLDEQGLFHEDIQGPDRLVEMVCHKLLELPHGGDAAKE